MNKKNYLPFITISLITMVSLLVALVIISNENNCEYNMIILLPVMFSVISILFYSAYTLIGKKIVFTILIGTYFVRMIVLPLMYSLSNYENTIILTESTNYYNSKAVILMIYEFFILMFFISMYYKKYYIRIENNETKIVRLKMCPINITIIYLLLCLIVFPNLKYCFKLLVNETTETVVNFHAMRHNVPGVIYWSFSIISDIIRPIIVLAIVLYLYNKYKNKKKKFLPIFISLVVILSNAVVTTNENARSIYILIGFIFLLVKLYPNISKKIIIFMTILIIIIVSGGLITKSKVSNNVYDKKQQIKIITSTFNAYFSGMDNVAVSLKIPREDTAIVMINDVIKSIPFSSLFFKIDRSSKNIFNEYLYGYNYKIDQIIPTIGQGYFYFGFLLSPMLTLIVVWIGIRFEIKAIKTTNIANAFSCYFAAIFCALVPVLYNFNIFLSNLFIIIIPLYLYTSKLSKVVNKD